MFVTSVTLGYHPKWTSQSNLLCAVFSQTNDINSSIFILQLSNECVPFFENLVDNNSSWFNWSFFFFFSLLLQLYKLEKDLGWSPESASPLVVSFFDLFLLVLFFFNFQKEHFLIKRCLPVGVCVGVRERPKQLTKDAHVVGLPCSCVPLAGRIQPETFLSSPILFPLSKSDFLLFIIILAFPSQGSKPEPLEVSHLQQSPSTLERVSENVVFTLLATLVTISNACLYTSNPYPYTYQCCVFI